jgi:hypothetical protein
MNAIREVGWWRWPLWSWRNLAVTVIGAALLVAGVGRLSEGGGSESVAAEPAATDTADPASIASSASPRQSTASALPTPSTTPVSPESPEEIAVAFVRVWARPDAAVEEWQASCQALSTTRFASALDDASSATVAASRAVGDTEVLRRSASAASVRVPTDGGAVHVALQRTALGWRVDGIEPEELSTVTSTSRS